jgi:hypothetical protein
MVRVLTAPLYNDSKTTDNFYLNRFSGILSHSEMSVSQVTTTGVIEKKYYSVK